MSALAVGPPLCSGGNWNNENKCLPRVILVSKIDPNDGAAKLLSRKIDDMEELIELFIVMITANFKGTLQRVCNFLNLPDLSWN